ncbi:hypothetical protein CEE39_03260 [bacterium (candidate division B38) B3_B38]|nr:MAG: hypothetical protein CEE39_03260 [bacterium (candidate division B38) B3_B38]
MIEKNSLVVAYLKEPREQIWGVLLSLDQSGVVIKGISLESFDDWCRQVAKGEESIGLSEMFIPALRVVKILLDEKVGNLPSFSEKFQKMVGMDIPEWLGLQRS